MNNLQQRERLPDPPIPLIDAGGHSLADHFHPHIDMKLPPSPLPLQI